MTSLADCKAAAESRLRLHLLLPGDPLSACGEQYLRQVYREHFGARLTSVPKRLLALMDRADRLLAVAGLRDSDSGFLSEAYLDQPLGLLASSLAGRGIGREDILEVSGLSARRPWAGLALLAGVIRLGRLEERKAGLFTATARLRKLLLRAGLPIHPLTPADARRLPGSAGYGRYYEEDPWVCLLLDSPEEPLALRSLEAPLLRSLPL